MSDLSYFNEDQQAYMKSKIIKQLQSRLTNALALIAKCEKESTT